MVLTNNQSLFVKLNLLRNHGITRDEKLMTHLTEGPWYYQQIALGFNYRMTDIQGALGRSQLSRLDEFIKKRHKIAKIYNNEFSDLPLKFQFHSVNSFSGMHLYVVRLDISINNKLKVFKLLREEGIGVNVHYIPVHLQPFYEQFGFKKGQFPEAEQYYNEAISLPLYPDLKKYEINKVIETLKDILL